MGKPSHLSFVMKYCYGVGHVFNDLCAAMWFSYLLVFFEQVLNFSHTNAGLVLLVGQLADGFSTPVVGIFSDKENKIPSCARYGRRKVWHLLGTIFVLVSFPFIFTRCLGCRYADENLQLAYYCFFVILFQFGWASVQISHLSLIPELTSKKDIRTELNSIRYAFTVLSSLSVYAIAFVFLDSQTTTPGSDSSYNYNSSSPSSVDTTTPSFDFSVSPEDADEFRNMALFCICVGSFFSAIFHFGVKEPPFRSGERRVTIESSEKSFTFHRMRKTDWFKEISFYQVAVLYMATRLYVNLYQVYIPLYVQTTLHLSKSAIATVPFVMYLAGFFGSLIMKKANKTIGRKGTFGIGTIIGLIGCTAVAFGSSEAYKTWGVYCVAAILGTGGSTVLITSLSITADLIGSNVEGGAFVFGFMSLVDKVSNGLVIMIIQSACGSDPEFYKYVITYGCGSACLLGLIITVTLIPVKIGQRRGVSKSVATLINEEEIAETSLKSEPHMNGSHIPVTISATIQNQDIEKL